MAVVVSDTSPIRALAFLGLLHLLPELFGEVFIPPAVVAELERPRARFAPVAVGALAGVRVREATDRKRVAELLTELHAGEAEAIALAMELHASALLIDESDGRSVADRLGLATLGVLGLLLRAKQQGRVNLVGPLLERLKDGLGFYIAPKLREAVLRQAGE